MFLRHLFKTVDNMQVRRYSRSYEKKTFAPLDKVNVTIMNANSPVGEATALIVKNDPLVRELTIHCKSGTAGIQKDLSLIPTSTNVHAFTGFGQLKHALRKADIVLVMEKHSPDGINSSKEMFLKNLEYTKFMAEACVQHCPNAIIIVDVYPINSTVPYFAEILSENGVFCANKLMGSVALHSLRARTLLGKMLGIIPNKVHVDIIGGGTPETVIPVVSPNNPGGPAIEATINKLRKKIKYLNVEVISITNSQAVLSNAYSLAGFIHQIAEGLTGKQNVKTNAFIRTSALMGMDFFTMPIGLGLAGIETNYGIPKLSAIELQMMDEALPKLQSDIAFGVKHARPPPEVKQNESEQSTPICAAIPCEFP
ncbi:malate dehydrogenase, mitochondrial-like isoform X2 [Cimex lectularius]|uniref:Malate dehydrogenase, mitochondrial n=1 Tax=Cimex lectularius TaxID=79782 RepID=A0A8I6TDQ6_CIMLE|nr:malate dehydrogenase, mitochondrial-like isoform X2 [Cimex lectularius]